MINLGAVVKTKDVRVRDGGAIDSEARAVTGSGSCGISEGRQIPSLRPVVQMGDQVLRAVICRDWGVAGDDSGIPGQVLHPVQADLSDLVIVVLSTTFSVDEDVAASEVDHD